MKCQNCGSENAEGAQQCALCKLPLGGDDKASRVGAAPAKANAVPIFLAVCGVILLGVIGYFMLAPVGGASPENPVLPTDIDERSSSEPEPVQPTKETPPTTLPTPTAAGEGGSAADRHPAEAPPTGMTSDGRLSGEAITGVMRRNVKDVRACFEQGLKRTPTLAGVVKVAFVIGTDGKVTKVSAQDTGFPDPAVTECIIKVVFETTFPKPEGGIVRVVYPFNLTPQ